MDDVFPVARDRLAQLIHDRCLLTGEFTLRSGKVANHYFDKYQFESDPVLLRSVARLLAESVPDGVEILAGLEMGGIPVASMLSLETGLPTVFVRKKAKEYGTAKLAEGPSIEGRTLLIVEDVVTSGGQIRLSAADLRERGATIAGAVCVIDRGEGGAEALREDGIELTALFRGAEIEAAGASG